MTRRKFTAISFLLASLAVIPPGCGSDLDDEVAGVLFEEITFAVGFARTGQPVCQGPPSRCGPPGLLALITPDCPLGVACFGDSCNDHDRCYGTCGTTKEVCDDRFLENLLGVCSDAVTADGEPSERCIGLAYIYWQAVVRLGQIAFDISQDVNCDCLGVVPNRNTAAKNSSELGPEFYPFDDVDDDLMPDAWEREFGLDTANPDDALKDPDADGIPNLDEYILGSDPHSPDWRNLRPEEQ